MLLNYTEMKFLICGKEDKNSTYREDFGEIIWINYYSDYK